MVDNNGSGGGASHSTREQGIEFGQLKDKLESHEYPATNRELLAAHGHAELGLPEGSETLREILGKRQSEQDGSEDIRYESAEEVQQSIFNMVGSDAVGRENYSDRGAAHHDEIKGGKDRDKKSL